MKYFILLFVSLAFVSCCHNSEKKENVAKKEIVKAENNGILIKYKKTGCFGACATFNLTITSDGKMLYNGLANVKNIGSFEASISGREFNDILYYFEKIDFWSLEDKYTDTITDLPTTFITISKDGRIKEVEDYYGAPKKLKDLENYLDKFIESQNWTKTN